MQNQFGTDWKTRVSELISWRGLERSPEFNNWYINAGYPTGVDAQGNTTYPVMSTTISTIQLLGNSNRN